MSAVKVLLFVIAGIVAVALLGAGCAYQGYNRAIGLDEAVKNSWAQVENQLQRRFDLLSNLEATVKGVARQEGQLFVAIAEARTKYFQADRSGSVSEKAEAANQIEQPLSAALSRLLFLHETYPELKSNEAFMNLQHSIEGTENRLAVARRDYNETVQQLNVFARQFPGRFFASLAGVEPGVYYKVPETAKTNPKIDFSDIKYRDKEKEK